MPLSEIDLKFLSDMLLAARNAASLGEAVVFDVLIDDLMDDLSTERVLEFVEDAARQMLEEGRNEEPLNWITFTGQRRTFSRDYGKDDLGQLCRISLLHVSALIRVLEQILDADPSGPDALGSPAER